MKIKGLDFYKTCTACPEQYDVMYDDQPAGYVRLRYGGLRVDYPECMDETIYTANVGGEWTGSFESDEQRQYYLNIIADKIWGKIHKEV